MPCGPGAPRIYVDEDHSFDALWANPLICAERGLCFTEASAASLIEIETADCNKKGRNKMKQEHFSERVESFPVHFDHFLTIYR